MTKGCIYTKQIFCIEEVGCTASFGWTGNTLLFFPKSRFKKWSGLCWFFREIKKKELIIDVYKRQAQGYAGFPALLLEDDRVILDESKLKEIF